MCSLHLHLNLKDCQDDSTVFVDDLYQLLSYEQKPYGLQWAWSMGVATSAKIKTLLTVESSPVSPIFCALYKIGEGGLHYRQIHYAYELLRCLKVKICQFSW